jgi:hypothetical protein
VIAACLAASSLQAAQLFVPTGRDTLRRLPGIEVLVEPVQTDLERVGLTSDRVVAALVPRLESAGITVYRSQKANPSISKPYLYIHLNAVATDNGAAYALAIQVQVRQTMSSLTTESRVVDAMTWDAHTIVVVPAVTLRDDAQRQIDALVASFIEDWTSVH